MSYVVNRATLEVTLSVNTADYSEAEYLINPELPTAPQYLWKVTEDGLTVMVGAEADAAEAARLAEMKEDAKAEMELATVDITNQQYPPHRREMLQRLYHEADRKNLEHRLAYLMLWIGWIDQGTDLLFAAIKMVDEAGGIGDVLDISHTFEQSTLQEWAAADPLTSIETTRGL